MTAPATQRILPIRREYNAWVADETLEDYALRYAPLGFRKWSFSRIANTALGAVSFLALEAIGGTIALNWGFTNAVWAIGLVALVIFLTGLPISYYAAREALDMDLLTRGAGFGYIGSTITSLIYASFTFIFFAIEAAIMALALELWFGLPLQWGYLLSSLVVIPLVTHGITWISRLQAWTQPVFVVLLLTPFFFMLVREPELYVAFTEFGGRHGNSFDWLAVGAGCTVAVALISQIGEQVDFLRFLPPPGRRNTLRWWASVIAAGPGWIIPGALKMLGGAFLAFVALQAMVPPDKALQPTQMYLAGFGHVVDDPRAAVALACVFVIICQVKINVTNAYAGSLAWSNFFSRLTHSHPGRVVWLIFNVLIALMLMLLGVFEALEQVLGVYASVAVAWIGAVVADLVVNKPLGLSPRHIEFKRAYLYDINPVGVGSMLAGSVLGIVAFGGHLGAAAQAFAPFISLGTAFVLAPLIAWASGGRYYLARPRETQWRPAQQLRCVVCENRFESEDMAQCPAYGGAICSLCCTLDARCRDRCKPAPGLFGRLAARMAGWMPSPASARVARRVGQFLLVFSVCSLVLAAVVALVYQQELIAAEAGETDLGIAFVRIFAVLVLLAALGIWWLVLVNESRRVAQEESERQNQLLLREIEAHRDTDAKLQQAKEDAEAANAAKSRYVRGISHELRTPLNTILGYCQIMLRDTDLPRRRRDAISTIQRSGEHLLGLIDGLLDIASIEAGRLQFRREEIRFGEFLAHIEKMFRLEAVRKGLDFRSEFSDGMPEVVQGDTGRLRQILINLLANAVRYTERGEVRLKIAWRSETAVFEVCDTGCGIAQEDMERIFLPFERGAGAGVASVPGTGLGLTITRLLVELAGGQLTVSSTPGRGSVFRVKLHLPRVARPKLALRPEREIRGYAGRRRCLLVVDDQPGQSRLIADMLRPRGFLVHECRHPDEVPGLLGSLQPDLVFLDVSMPVLDGWTLCRRLRDAGHGMPIVMVSANAYENLPQRREAAGCDDFIVKPVLETELFACLSAWLGLRWIYADAQAGGETGAGAGHTMPVPSPVPHALQRSMGVAGDALLTVTDLLSAVPDSGLSGLSARVRAELRDLADLGHLQGLVRRLDELEVLHPELQAPLASLREMTLALRFDALLRVLDEAADD
ncbi:ATP-binding protein [Thauera sp. Sel9]|uniref:ATP-binding protein n=1 Tax=Thauera sp. Sel9 TaxID=2974299 RepID=UPI0021E16117|nr:ATP-binding protein [Thauera sp. Sel9]MCV2217186.1 ATP-binding protein [Thauera sp. Sel9]